MTIRPAGFAIGPPFWARLALVLPDPIDQLEWSRQEHDNEVGTELIEYWDELFEVPDRDPTRWRRLVMPARSPFPTPGWVMYDAHLTNNGIAELRRVEYIAVEQL